MSEGAPEGWAEARLGDLARRVTKGATPTSYGFKFQSHGITFIKVENIRGGMVDHASLKDRISEEAHAAQARSRLCDGDVLFSIAGTIGTTCLIRPVDLPANTNQALAIIRGTSDVLDARYLQHALGHTVARTAVEKTARGGGMNNISLADVSAFRMLVPPLAEQRRIVEMVEALLSEVNAARTRLAKVRLILKRFRQSVLAAACAGRLTEEWRQRVVAHHRDDVRPLQAGVGLSDDLPDAEIPDSWSWVRAESLCEPTRPITYGVIKLGRRVEGGVPTLRSSDVRSLLIDLSSVKTIERRIADQYSRTYLRGGEVLVTVRGTLGGVGVVSSDLAGYNISREVAQLPLLGTLNPRFVMYAIASLASQRWLMERAKGVAYTGINIEDLRRLALPLPPQPEQDEIVKRVERMLELAANIERRVAAASTRADALTQSILAKAFRGELVPTEAELARAEGRNHESAEALLTRIHTERNASVLPKGRQRARLAQGRSVSRGRTE